MQYDRGDLGPSQTVTEARESTIVYLLLLEWLAGRLGRSRGFHNQATRMGSSSQKGCEKAATIDNILTYRYTGMLTHLRGAVLPDSPVCELRQKSSIHPAVESEVASEDGTRNATTIIMYDRNIISSSHRRYTLDGGDRYS